MPGPLAHLLLASSISPTVTVNERPWLYAGAVACDYGYTMPDDPQQFLWSDLCHAASVGSKFGIGIDALSTQRENGPLRAWLIGYATHLVADAFIHPVVNLAVGKYEENQKKHRRCEQSQDIYLLKSHICKGEPPYSSLLKLSALTHFDDSISMVWNHIFEKTHPNHYKSHPPAIAKWHELFVERLKHFLAARSDKPEEVIALLTGYKRIEPYDERWVKSLKVPFGQRLSYKSIFEKATVAVKEVIQPLVTAIDAGNYDNPFGSWDIDAGGVEGKPLDATSGNSTQLLFWQP